MRPRPAIPRNRLGKALLAAALAAWLPGTAHAVRIEYVVDAAIEHNDNLLLSPANPITTTILRPGLGFALTHASSAWQAEVSGRAEYFDYQDSRFENNIESNLNGRFNWIILPERLSFTIEDDLALQPVNTFVPDTPGNRQQVNVLSLGPTLQFNWTPTLHGLAELRYVNSDAEITDEFNSDRVSLALRAVKQLSAATRVSANVQAQHVDFDLDLIARDYDRYDAFARFERRLNHLQLGIDMGYSHIAYRSGGGDRSEPLMRMDATWSRNDRHRVVARLSSQFSDTATDALAGVEAETAIPGSVPLGEAVVNASPYRERGLELQYAFTSPRLAFSIAPYYNRLRYVDADAFDQDTSGARFDLAWHLRPRLTIGAHGGVSRIKYLQIDRRDETRELGAYVSYEWSRRLSSRLEFSRHERDLSIPGEDARRNIAMLTFSYHNR